MTCLRAKCRQFHSGTWVLVSLMVALVPGGASLELSVSVIHHLIS